MKHAESDVLRLAPGLGALGLGGRGRGLAGVEMALQDPEKDQYTPPPHQLATWALMGAAILAVLGLFSLRGPQGPGTTRDYPSRTLEPEVAPVLLPPPPASDDYWPCSDCHEEEPTDRTVRVLEDEHEDHELRHGNLWCLHCHAAEDRDKLHLADETLIVFEESWRLCTQCHAKKLADWRAGVHGKRTGHWWGPKEYWNCVSCHDPHVPPFKALEPKPAPKPPTQIVLNSNAPGETVHE